MFFLKILSHEMFQFYNQWSKFNDSGSCCGHVFYFYRCCSYLYANCWILDHDSDYIHLQLDDDLCVDLDADLDFDRSGTKKSNFV